MSLPWYCTQMSRTFSLLTMPIYPFVIVLEAIRGTFVSAMSLAVFIDLSGNPPPSATRDLQTLRVYLDSMKTCLELLPEWAQPLFGVWIDYYYAADCFYTIATQIAIHQSGIDGMPDTCAGSPVCQYQRPID
jgi:hypothetical protein